jgi:hypothetical protein
MATTTCLQRPGRKEVLEVLEQHDGISPSALLAKLKESYPQHSTVAAPTLNTWVQDLIANGKAHGGYKGRKVDTIYYAGPAKVGAALILTRGVVDA